MSYKEITVELGGYQIMEQIHHGERSKIYQAIRSLDNRPVVIKFSTSPTPSGEETLRMHREYELGSMCLGDNTIAYLGLEETADSYAIILEDFSPTSLESYIPAAGLNMVQFLPITRQLVDGLLYIHDKGVAHRDINPGNIIIRQTKE